MTPHARTVYVAVKYRSDQSNRRLVEALCDAVAAAGHTPRSVVRDVERFGAVTLDPASLMSTALGIVDECDVVLVDLAERGVGIGIECGYAYAIGSPVVVCLPDRAELSATLGGIAVAVGRYRSVEDLPGVVATLLTEANHVPAG